MLISKENKKLLEQIEGYKIMNQNRLDLLLELETQNIELVKNKKIILEKENEINMYEKMKRDYESKLNEIKRSKEEQESKNDDLKQEISDITKIMENNNIASRNVIDSLHEKILAINLMVSGSELDNEKGNNEFKESRDSKDIKSSKSNSNIKYFSDLIIDSLKELKLYFESKTSNLYNKIKSIQDISNKTDELFTKIINEKYNTLTSFMNKTKSQYEQDCDKMLTKISNIKEIKSNKANQRIEDLKSQIVDLIPYKLKTIELEAKVEKGENTLVHLIFSETLIKYYSFILNYKN